MTVIRMTGVNRCFDNTIYKSFLLKSDSHDGSVKHDIATIAKVAIMLESHRLLISKHLLFVRIFTFHPQGR